MLLWSRNFTSILSKPKNGVRNGGSKINNFVLKLNFPSYKGKNFKNLVGKWWDDLIS